jgi:hypothetical protein
VEHVRIVSPPDVSPTVCELRSFAALAVGFPVAIAVAVGVALLGRWTGLGPGGFTADGASLARVVAHPDGYAVLIGLLAGTAGMLSLSTASRCRLPMEMRAGHSARSRRFC